MKKNGLKITPDVCILANCNNSQQDSESTLINGNNVPCHTSKVLFNNNIDLVNGKNIPNGDTNHGCRQLTHRLSLPVNSQNQQGRKLPTSYLKDLRVHRHSLTYRGAMLNINRYRLRASSCPDIYRNSMTTIAMEKDEVCTWVFLLSNKLLMPLNSKLNFNVCIYFFYSGMLVSGNCGMLLLTC